jgi:nucleoside-diphosphate-sugar epimerase
MQWKDKKILVTGGAGFIGSHLVNTLLNLGSDLYVADNFSRGTREHLAPILDKIHLYNVDLVKSENCVLVTRGMDYVFHLAASVGGIHYIRKENVAGSTSSLLMNTNMLEAARLNDIQRFLFTSSACVYREKSLELNRFREEDAYPAHPLTTYGWVKLLGEIQCRSYHLDYGLKSSVPRIFNAYGCMRKVILYPQEDFSVFGDGQQERAFLYIKDCVEGLILAMEKSENADPINLGSDAAISINELVQKIIAISGKDIEIDYDLSGIQGTHRYCADTSKMQRVLGWRPKIKLEEGLKRTYKWAQSILLH